MSRSLVSSVALALVFASSGALAQSRWLRGDLHVHDDHSSDGSGPRQVSDQQLPGNVSIQDQIAAALLLSNLEFLPLTDHRTYDQHYDPLWESPDLLLIPGEEANGSPHATVQGAIDSIVQGANPDGAPDSVRLQHSIWDAHLQDANWVTAHPDDGEMNDDNSANARASAVGPDLVEVWNRASKIDREMIYAEDRWNHGFRFGIAGACDDHFREVWANAGPGMPTTHVLASAVSERAVIDGLRRGNTVITAPLIAPFPTLEADFDGDGVFEAAAGDEVVARPGRHGTLRVHVTNAGGDTVNVYRAPGKIGGAPWQSFTPALVETDVSYDVDVVADATPTWYRIEVRGLGLPASYDISSIPISLIPDPTMLPDQLLALTSPIFVGPSLAVPQPEIALPADAGRKDGAVHAIGARRAFAGFPDVAVTAGVTHLVAETHASGATRVEYVRRAAAGSFSAPLAISGTATSARFPKIAALGADVWVVWQDERSGQVPHRPEIWLRHSADGGATWDDEQRVRAIDGRCEHPALALVGGKPVVAWQEISANHAFDVMVQALGVDAGPQNVSGAGKTIMAATPADTRSSRYPASVWPSLAASRSGQLVVAWQDNRNDPDPLWTGQTQSGDGTDPDDWQIMLRARPAPGGSWGPVTTLGDAARADRHPSAAFSAAGVLAVAWDSKALESSGVNLSILSAVSRDAGATFAAPVPVGLDANAMSQFPRLGRDAGGRIRAVWYDSRSTDWRWRIATSMLSAGAWTAARVIPSRGNNAWPATDGGAIAFATMRNAARVQRDRTTQVFVLQMH
jgi:hypothetical protein